MRIKKKAPKPSAKRPPLYFIGYRGAAPQPGELKTWYDLEYGGPLSIKIEEGTSESWHAGHGPWSAHVVIPLPSTHTTGLKEQLAWEHESMGAIAPSIMPPRDMPDTVLFSARLARGLTLLTQGTAYDVTTGNYLNPSDWQDRPLSAFLLDDHLTIVHDDSSRADVLWSYSLGMNKFGLDEVETFQQKGLPEQTAKELIAESARELLHVGLSPKVGSVVRLPLLGRTVRVVNYRTAQPAGRMVGFREVRG